MNQNRFLTTLMAIVLGLSVALYVIVQVTSSNTNSLGTVFHYLPIGTFFIGLLAPRTGMYILLVLGAVLDKLTNILYLTGSVAFFDEKLLKLSAPLCLLGILLSSLRFAFATEDYVRRKNLWTLFSLSIVMTVILFGAALLAYMEYGLIPAMSFALTFAPYGMLLFVAPALFTKSTQLKQWMIAATIIILLASVIGIRQHFFGFTRDEEWLAMITQAVQFQYEFENPRAMGWFRYPGTLSGVTATTLAYLCVIFIKKKQFNISKFQLFIGILLFVVTAICLYSSGKRLGIGMFFITIFYFFVFRSAVRTAVMYLIAFITLGVMIFYPDQVIQKLLDTQQAIFAKAETSEGADQVKFVARLGTFSARVETFALLAKSTTYTPWGKDERDLTQEEIDAHSLPVQILIGQGYVPTIFMAIVSVIVLLYFHRAFVSANLRGTMAYYMFCIFAAQMTAAFLGAKYIAGFPMCFFLGLELGLVAMGVLTWRSQRSQLKTQVHGKRNVEMKSAARFGLEAKKPKGLPPLTGAH